MKNSKTRHIHKCVFPAAGYGTRFLPVTKSSPKEMLPIINKPLIHYGVEEAYQAGMRDMMFIVGRNKEAIVNYFDINVELEERIRGTKTEDRLTELRALLQNCVFSYIRQGEIRGLGHAILMARHHMEKQAFAVCLADDLCLNADPTKGGVLSEMCALYEQHRCTILAAAEVPQQEVSQYGIIDAKPLGEDLFEARALVEKPPAQDAPSNLAIIGRYILSPSVFEYLAQTKTGAGGEVQLTDALAEQVQHERMLVYKIKQYHFDCGDLGKYAKAIRYVSQLRGLSTA